MFILNFVEVYLLFFCWLILFRAQKRIFSDLLRRKEESEIETGGAPPQNAPFHRADNPLVCRGVWVFLRRSDRCDDFADRTGAWLDWISWRRRIWGWIPTMAIMLHGSRTGRRKNEKRGRAVGTKKEVGEVNGG